MKNTPRLREHRQAGPPYFLLLKVRGVGFEPQNSGDIQKPFKWRCSTFLRSLLPLFFCRGRFLAGRVASLAGDEKDEWKNCKVPLLQQDFALKVLEKVRDSDPGDD